MGKSSSSIQCGRDWSSNRNVALHLFLAFVRTWVSKTNQERLKNRLPVVCFVWAFICSAAAKHLNLTVGFTWLIFWRVEASSARSAIACSGGDVFVYHTQRLLFSGGLKRFDCKGGNKKAARSRKFAAALSTTGKPKIVSMQCQHWRWRGTWEGKKGTCDICVCCRW